MVEHQVLAQEGIKKEVYAYEIILHDLELANSRVKLFHAATWIEQCWITNELRLQHA
jgi:hypothetical protein